MSRIGQVLEKSKSANPTPMTWTGSFVMDKNYNQNDVVEYEGKNYVCISKETISGHLPTDTTYWMESGDILFKQEADANYQPVDADLTAIADLAGNSGFLKKTVANSWSLDTSTYLTSESDPIASAALTTHAALTGNSVHGLGTASTVNTGTSGATIPLLNGNNTWSGTQYINLSSTTAFKVGSTPDILIDTTNHTITCGTATAAQDTFFTIQTTKLIAAWGGTVSADWTTFVTTGFNINPSFSGKPTMDGMMIVGLGGKAYWSGSITDNGKDGITVGGTNYEGGIVGFVANLTQGKTHLVYGAKFTTYAHDYVSMGNWKSNLNYIAGIFDASGDNPTSPGVAQRLGIYSYDSVAITTAQKLYLSSTLNNAVLTLGGDYLTVPTINTEIDFYVNNVKQAVIDSSGVFNAVGGYKVNGSAGIDCDVYYYDENELTTKHLAFSKGILVMVENF